ncbi:MAG: zf-HC2 domain-containing protein [Rhodoplanes sp.]
MQCEEARGRIGALIDGELAGEPRRDVEAHVEACERCGRELADLKRLQRQVGAVRASAPPALADRVRAALATEAAREVGTRPLVPAVRSLDALRI